MPYLMCGISGVFGAGATSQRAALQRSLDKLAHRGPDAKGIWEHPQCLLGNRRLAIIDVRRVANQPITNEDGDVAVTFNGELYNHRELRRELQERGHTFRTNADTECVVHAYEEYGETCVKRFVGMFAFVLFDRKRKRLMLARDRLGEKPLYYAVRNGLLYFASELDALLAYPIEREIDLEGVQAYFAYAHIPAPLTAFLGVRKLLPAHYLIAEGGEIQIKTYWKISSVVKIQSLRAAAAECRVKLTQAVRTQLVADVPVGVLLSSGVDSNGIVAIMRQLHARVRTFTVGLRTPTFTDMEYQRAQRCIAYHGVESHTIAYDFSGDRLPELLRHYGEPFNLYPMLYTDALCRCVHENGVKAVLAGNGADELFGGYDGYPKIRRTLLLSSLLRWVPQPLIKVMLSALRLPPDISILATNNPLRFRLLSVMLPARRNAAMLFSPEIAAQLRGTDVTLPLKSLSSIIGGHDPMQVTYLLDLLCYHAHSVTTLGDISGMTHSVELRNPFLDHRVVEFAAALPVQYKTPSYFASRKNKLVLKRALEPLLPKEMLYAQKLTFGNYITIKRVLGDRWEERMEEVLLGGLLESTRLFNMAYVRKIWGAYRKGNERHDHLLWGLYCFALWHSQFMQSETARSGVKPGERAGRRSAGGKWRTAAQRAV